MLKAKNISLYKIMTAGYLSSEAYTALKPKTHFNQLNLNECLSYPSKISLELQRLFKDDITYHALCGMEQMETSLSDEDNRPYELLETLLLQDDGNVKDFLLKVGSKVFLLGYVFSSREDLCTRSFITDNNITSVTHFIIKYETAFTQMYSDGEILAGTLTNEPMSYSDEYKTNEHAVDVFVGESSVSYNETNSIFNRTHSIVTIDDDAVSNHNNAYKQYVIILSRLTEEEFEPFKKFFERMLLNVSVRTSSRIKFLGYQEFYVNYLFADDKKLMSIQNIGRKSVYDFNKIRPSLINHIENTFSKYVTLSESLEKAVETISEEIRQEKLKQNLTLKDLIGDIKYAMLDNALNGMIAKLSVRAKNGINHYQGDFIEDFVHKDKDIKSLKNVGEKTENEIFEVICKLKEMAEEAMNTKEVSPEEQELMRYQIYYGSCWDEYTYQYFTINGHLPMFHILENWITNQTDRNWNITKSVLPIFANTETKSLNDVANEFGVTRERCRQIYASTIERLLLLDEAELLSSNITISKLLIEKKEEWQYITKKFDNMDFMDVGIISPFILEENCSLSPAFGFYILSVLLANEYTLVGREIISYALKTKQTWHNTYLIKREIAEAFNFYEIPKLVEETESTLTQDMEMDAESLVIDTFFSAWNSFDTNKVNVVSDILSSILIKECGKMPNDRFQFTLEGKKEVHVQDIIYDILSRRGDPMAIDDVFTEVNEICPKRCTAVYRLKYYITNDPRVCMIGMTNMVGLLEWNHVKIGSIRDIMVQYLSKFEEPKYIKDIVKYVQQYRDTNEHNIRSSLGSGSQFVHFDGGLFGLKDKTYSSKYSICTKLKSFQQRVIDMEIFLRDNLRFPFCNADDKEEDRLYTWWRRKLIEDGLSDEQREEILRIQDQYKDYPSNRIDDKWCRSYRAYKAFIEEQKRKPMRCNSKEKHLCSWFDRCKVDFNEGNMSSSKEKMYIELCNLL